MKANQAFKQADEAVSPVIGVILMVAITVVLAAVVFVLVGNLTDTSDQAPQVVFTKSGSGNSTVLTVQSTSEPTNWEDYTFSTTQTGCTATTAAANPGPITAGQTIEFSTSTADCIGATFNLVHDATNQISGRANL